MTPEEYDYLLAYWMLYGFGESKADQRAALIASAQNGEYKACIEFMGREYKEPEVQPSQMAR